MSLIEFIDFPALGDERGSLVALEAEKSVPFEIKRVYYIFGTKNGVARGFHAHKKLQQIAICITGKCRMILDNGKERSETWLDSPNKGLVIGDLVWREMHDFSDDCVLLVLASEHYDESDYIRDYDEFITYTQLKLVKYDHSFLDKSWHWLNDIEIKRLTMTSDFSKHEQKEFFESLSLRDDYYIYGLTFKDIPIGACGLKNIKDDIAELWLYIGEKEYWGKGLGKKIMYNLELKAKDKGMRKIYLKVSKENIKAINMYGSLNYKNSGEYINYITMEKLL